MNIVTRIDMNFKQIVFGLLAVAMLVSQHFRNISRDTRDYQLHYCLKEVALLHSLSSLSSW